MAKNKPLIFNLDHKYYMYYNGTLTSNSIVKGEPPTFIFGQQEKRRTIPDFDA